MDGLRIDLVKVSGAVTRSSNGLQEVTGSNAMNGTREPLPPYPLEGYLRS